MTICMTTVTLIFSTVPSDYCMKWILIFLHYLCTWPTHMKWVNFLYSEWRMCWCYQWHYWVSICHIEPADYCMKLINFLHIDPDYCMIVSINFTGPLLYMNYVGMKMTLIFSTIEWLLLWSELIYPPHLEWLGAWSQRPINYICPHWMDYCMKWIYIFKPTLNDYCNGVN